MCASKIFCLKGNRILKKKKLVFRFKSIPKINKKSLFFVLSFLSVMLMFVVITNRSILFFVVVVVVVVVVGCLL